MFSIQTHNTGVCTVTVGEGNRCMFTDTFAKYRVRYPASNTPQDTQTRHREIVNKIYSGVFRGDKRKVTAYLKREPDIELLD